MIIITGIISLTLMSITGFVYLCVKRKSEQKEKMIKDICNTIEKIVKLRESK